LIRCRVWHVSMPSSGGCAYCSCQFWDLCAFALGCAVCRSGSPPLENTYIYLPENIYIYIYIHPMYMFMHLPLIATRSWPFENTCVSLLENILYVYTCIYSRFHVGLRKWNIYIYTYKLKAKPTGLFPYEFVERDLWDFLVSFSIFEI